MAKCPTCGGYVGDKVVTFEGSQRSILKNMAGAVMAPVPPRPVVMREQPPAGLPNWESHVQVPRSQAITSGLFAAPIGGVLFYGAANLVSLSSSSLELTNSGAALIGLAGAVLFGFSVAWWKWEVKQNKYDGLLYRVEEWTGMDLNGDETIGEPEAQPSPVVQVETVDPSGRPRQIAEFEIDLPRFQTLARLIVEDEMSFSERTALEAGFSREEWVKLREEFIKHGWVTWKHPREPKQGLILRKQGVSVLEKVLSSPLLGDGIPQNSVGSTHARNGTHESGSNYERFEHIER